MKKNKVLWLLPFLFSGASAVHASWLDGSPYVGGGVGYSVYDGLDDLASDEDAVDFQRTSKNALGFQAFAGWTFPGYYSLELSVADFGEFEINEAEYVGNETYSTDITGGITGTGIGMRYDWAESNSMNAYGRIGVMRWEATWDVDQYSTDSDEVFRSEGNTNGTEFYIGVGGQYRIMSTLYAYVEGYYLDAKFDQDGFDTKQRVYSVFGGIMYRFGEVGRHSGTTDKRTREVTACDPKYKDISGVMCE